MRAVVVALSVETIPIGVMVGAAFDRSLRRRPRFWLRFAGIVSAIVLPELVAVVAPVGEQTVVTLILLGLGWGILLLVPSRFVLFHGWGFDPGSADDDGDGPGPEDERPTPPSPIGGIPLPDAEPSSARVRDHRPPRRAARHRRPARERERPPSPLARRRSHRARQTSERDRPLQQESAPVVEAPVHRARGSAWTRSVCSLSRRRDCGGSRLLDFELVAHPLTRQLVDR